MTTPPPSRKLMNWSLSAFQDWQQCEEKYYLKHVRQLKSTAKAPPLERGIILHDYMEVYYQALKDRKPADDAHVLGMEKLHSHTERVDIASAAAYYAGDEEMALELRSMPEQVEDIAQRYYRIRGKGDADRFQIVAIERWLRMKITSSAISNSKVDLVTRDRNTGRTYLWEHKTTGNVPSSAFRIRDLQTSLYARALSRETDDTTKKLFKIDAIMWNYLRTKAPAIPHQNKSTKANPVGALSKAVSIDTTWEKYADRIVELGLDYEDYVDIYERLRDAETTVFFPRYEMVIVADSDLLILDYSEEASRAYRARLSWADGTKLPVRTLTRSCDYCEFYKVCEAALMGGDKEEVIAMRFAPPKEVADA